MNRSTLVLFCCLLLANFHAQAKLVTNTNTEAFADQQRVFASNKNLKINSAQQAASKVMGRYGGKVLKVSKQGVNGGPGYKVKLLKDNGQIITVVVDATSGRLKGK
jgi:uncharacterized membrane protein YkoI